jgi:hypothetical protein
LLVIFVAGIIYGAITLSGDKTNGQETAGAGNTSGGTSALSTTDGESETKEAVAPPPPILDSSTTRQEDPKQIIEKMLRAYVELDSSEERLNYIYNADALRDQVIAYETEFPKPGSPAVSVTEIHKKQDEVEGPKYWVSTVTTESGENLFFPVFMTAEGPKVDWVSHNGYNNPSLQAFLDSRPSESKMFRVMVKSSTVYAEGFKDKSIYLSTEISTNSDPTPVQAYLHPETENAIALIALLKRAEPEIKQVILRLAVPQDSSAANVVLIQEVVATGWVHHE